MKQLFLGLLRIMMINCESVKRESGSSVSNQFIRYTDLIQDKQEKRTIHSITELLVLFAHSIVM